MKRAPFPQSPLSFQNETLPNLSLQNETLPNDTCIGFQNLLDVQLDEDELLNETIGLESRGLFDTTTELQLELKASSSRIKPLSPLHLSSSLPLPPIIEPIAPTVESLPSIDHVSTRTAKPSKKPSKVISTELPLLTTAVPVLPKPAKAINLANHIISQPPLVHPNPLPPTIIRETTSVMPLPIQSSPKIADITLIDDSTLIQVDDMFSRRRRDSCRSMGGEISFDFGGRMGMQSTPARPGAIRERLEDILDISAIGFSKNRVEVEEIIPAYDERSISILPEKVERRKAGRVRVEVPLENRRKEQKLEVIPTRTTTAIRIPLPEITPSSVTSHSPVELIPHTFLRASRVISTIPNVTVPPLSRSRPIASTSTTLLPYQSMKASAKRALPSQVIEKVKPKQVENGRRTLTLPEDFTWGQSKTVNATLAKKKRVNDENQRVLDEAIDKKRGKFSDWGRSSLKGKGKAVEKESDTRSNGVGGYLPASTRENGWSENWLKELETEGSARQVRQSLLDREQEREKLRSLKLGLRMIDEVRMR